jgi:hypothetical protein
MLGPMNQPDQDSIKINQVLDDFVADAQANFHALLLATATQQLGEEALSRIASDSVVEFPISTGIHVEPIPIAELRTYSATFPDFLLQVFHGKTIALWHGLLQELFGIYLAKHISGSRLFAELKGRQVKIDFRSTEGLQSQIEQGVIRDFGFDKYAERQKLINCLRNPSNSREDELCTIHTHVHVRNAFQHHDGTLDQFALNQLGRNRIALLDRNSNPRNYNVGDQVEISLPEFDRLQTSLLLVAQAWRS